MRDRSTPVWVKSSRCDASNCVEVADMGPEILIRNSLFPAGDVVGVSRRDWGAFVAAVASGRLASAE
ncbi:DUF397 domain-containing protein [Dactylosporangium sp. CA-139066]|uniref:DUF397 domain-containing protein n=1 Tax=Dactylosporangium sp. CA-139066 TaxID=3239930 RepID=UPI003D925F8E